MQDLMAIKIMRIFESDTFKRLANIFFLYQLPYIIDKRKERASHPKHVGEN
ncbi:hypothetical protein Plhal703r1_c59g0164751 [Plasmopara halstedii]